MTAVRRRFAVALLLLVALAVPLGCETVPYTGRRQIQLVSPSEEAQMGVQSFKEIVGKATCPPMCRPTPWSSAWAAGSRR